MHNYLLDGALNNVPTPRQSQFWSGNENQYNVHTKYIVQLLIQS
jgi:hypothetical protein